MSESFSPLDRLRTLVAFVRRFQHQLEFNQRGPKLPQNPTPFDRIRHVHSALVVGALPDAETLEFLREALHKYIEMEDQRSLDEAFSLQSKSGVGNPSAIFSKRNLLNAVLFEMAWMIAEDKNITQEDAAESAIKKVVPEKHRKTFENKDLPGAYRKRDFKRVEEIIRLHHLKPLLSN